MPLKLHFLQYQLFFPCCSVILIVAKKCKQIESNTVFLAPIQFPEILQEIEIFHQI